MSCGQVTPLSVPPLEIVPRQCCPWIYDPGMVVFDPDDEDEWDLGDAVFSSLRGGGGGGGGGGPIDVPGGTPPTAGPPHTRPVDQPGGDPPTAGLPGNTPIGIDFPGPPETGPPGGGGGGGGPDLPPPIGGDDPTPGGSPTRVAIN